MKDLSDHFVALSWRLDLQEQMLRLRLSEVHTEPGGWWWGVAGKVALPSGSSPSLLPCH